MLPGLDNLREDELVRWIEAAIHSGENAHGHGYQGQVYLYEDHGRRLIIKVASGSVLTRWPRRRMLRKEHAVYRHLEGFRGSPRCYGLLRGRYLLLEYVDGTPLRQATVTDERLFFERLLAFIKELHQRGVAHADLKRKANLLVVGGDMPCLIDFGAAVVRKPGFAPLNHFLYDLARQFDFNAWVKLKHRFVERAPAEDLAYYRRTVIERVARRIKRAWLAIKKRISARG